MNPIRLLTFGLLLAALAGSGIAGPARAAGTFAEAARLEQARDYDGALAAYAAFLQAQPGDELAGTAAMAIANIELLVRRNPERAVEAYDRVLRDYAQSGWGAEAARRKAECLQALERWSEAGEAYGRALELTGSEREPHSAGWIQEVSLAAADCFYRSGERERVIATYEKALAGNLPSDAAAATLYRLGDCYETSGDESQAAARYAQILEGYPFAPVFNDALAKRELIERHRALDWASCEAFTRMRAAIRGGDFAVAESLAAAIVAGSGSQALRDGAEYNRIGAHALRTGEFEEGYRQMVALAAQRPDLARVVPSLDQRIQFYAAIAAMQAGLRANPENADGWRDFGEMASRAGAVGPAVDALERAAAIEPGNSDTALLLGYAYAAAGRVDDATRAFDLYLERNPQDGATCNQIGYTYLAANRPEQALPYFRRYAALAPEEANAHDSLGEGLMRAGKLAEAAAEYETAIRLEPGLANPCFMLGEIYRELGDRAKAAAAYTRFIELAPEDDRAADAHTRIEELD
jgi:tetratricopeptide (TPR) repeat protein